MKNINYKTAFEQSPALALIMDTHYIIVAVSDAYLVVSKTTRESMVGRYIFDIFPDNPDDLAADGETKIRSSINHVIRNKTIHTITVLKYDIPRPVPEGGGFTIKYWKTSHSPVLDEFNNVQYIIQLVEDVTEKETLTTLLEKEQNLSKKVEDSEKRFSLLLMKSPFAFAILKGKEMVITLANEGIKKIWRKGSEVEGRSLHDVLPELKDTLFPGLLNEVYTTGVPFYGEELMVGLKRGDKLDNLYCNFIYQPYLEADESISGVIIIAYEVTEMVLTSKRIEESERRFQGAIAAVQGILWTNNANGGMQGVQQGWSALTGQSFEQYQGHGWLNAVHPEDKAPTLAAWNEAVNTQNKFLFEHRLKLKDGSWGQFSINAIPLFNADDSLLEWVGVHTDITLQRKAEKALKESEHWFRSMMETIPQIAWTNTIDLEVNFYNQLWYDYTGLNFEQSKSSGWQQVIYPDDLQDTLLQLRTIVKTMKSGEFQTRLRSSENQYRWHLIRLVPIKNEKSKLQLWAGTATDIEELKLLQQQKDDFISIASHELKTPVTSLKLSLQVLNELKEGLSNPMVTKLIIQANRSLDKFSVLIDDLFNVSKANDEQLHLNKKQFILSKVIDDCCSYIRVENEYKIKTEGDMELEVCADAERIEQIMINLVNNAIKYAPASKEIKVCIEKLQDMVKVSVSDKGPGIAKENIPQLFERYFRINNKGTQYSTGLGLGLYIAAEIIKKHNGQIGVESEIGKGSTFWFTLPL